MIDFACKQFIVDDVIKCALGITKAEFSIMKYFIENNYNMFTTENLAKKFNLNLSTVQKAVKKLNEKFIIKRSQKNLESGGYIFIYQAESKKKIRSILDDIIQNWADTFKHKINSW